MKWMFILLTCIQLFSSCKNCENKVVSYTTDEPYTDIEKIEVELSSRAVPNTMRYERKEGTIIMGENPKLSMVAMIENTSESDGTFEFNAILSSQGDKLEFKQSVFIPALSTGNVNIEKEINPFSFKSNIELDDYSIVNPTIVKDKEVTKYKSIIKYKNCNTCKNDCN